MAYPFSEIYTDVAEERYTTRTPDAGQKTESKRLTNLGYRELTGQADWHCLHPSATLALWATVTGTASISTVTITDSTNKPFLPSMVGHAIVMDTSETSYTISSVTSSSVVVVTADASTDDGDTFTITPDGNYTLPAGYAYMESGPIFNAPNSAIGNIHQVSPGDILQARAGSTSGTYALRWATRPLAFTTTQGQLWELMLHPTPGSALTVSIQYRLNPADMTADAEYPVGGNAFNLAVRAYGMRAVERTKQQKGGMRAQEAQEAFQSALVEDHRERASGPIKIYASYECPPPYSRRSSHLGVSVD